ncbi:MAG TPA: VWA domain-containing protein [Bryobacteraceae bacterium]|nr:VWA domain-containing protein [Bryobacteraceae bacterium]
MRNLVVCLLLAGLLGPCRAQAPSEQPAKPSDEEARSRIVLEVTRVNLLFTVTDRRGRFVTDLTQKDFTVREGKVPQKILEFSAESNLPLRLAILVDSSNSIRDRLRFIQESAIEFINSVMRPDQDKATVISFDTVPELQADLSSDIEQLTRVIRQLRAGGGTSLYDAIFYASRDKLMQDQPRHKFRRAMVVLSDGEDNQSRHSRDQALELAQKADVVIYTISTNMTRAETGGDKVLRYFAAETGGMAFFPFKAEDLSQSFENIANELRHQYSILYRPEPMKTDGSYQRVDIVVRDRSNLVVRSRRGYYSPTL